MHRLAGMFAVFIVMLAAPAVAQDKNLTVFAAASMKNALDDIDAAYTARTGVKITVSYAASSALAKQIELGAPADVFAREESLRRQQEEIDGCAEEHDRHGECDRAEAETRPQSPIVQADPRVEHLHAVEFLHHVFGLVVGIGLSRTEHSAFPERVRHLDAAVAALPD